MMAFSFLGPLIASVLYVVVFQKAGFRGPMLAFCAAPVLGALLSRMLIGLMSYAGPIFSLAFLVPMAFSLAPLFILAFKAWPPVSAAPTHTEK
ncbi:MAG: hypothetical protein R3D97_17050 [Paracoccaceae bacterium]